MVAIGLVLLWVMVKLGIDRLGKAIAKPNL